MINKTHDKTYNLNTLLIQFRFSVLQIIFQISISNDDTRPMVHFAWPLTASSKSPGPIRIILVFSNCGFLPIKGTTDISDIKIFVKYRQTLYWQIPTPKNYELRQSKVLLEIDVSWAHIDQQISLTLTVYNRYHITDQQKPQ